MVDDHGKANEQLKQVASTEGFTLPSSPSSKDKAEKERLEKLSGEEFDAAYMKLMLKDHKKDVAEFQHEAKSGNDPNVKDFASKTLPTLQEHLNLAQQIAPKYTNRSNKASGAGQ